MVRRSTEKELKQFLKERKLTRAFNTFKRLAPKRKRNLVVIQPDFAGNHTRSRIIVLKERGRTVIRDFFSLKILGTSKKSIPQTIKDIGSTRRIKSEKRFQKITRQKIGQDIFEKFRDYNVIENIKVSNKRLLNEKVTLNFNTIKQMTRIRTDRNIPFRKKFGILVMDVTLIGTKGERKRFETSSEGGHNLSSRRERETAKAEALIKASRIAEFSPVDVIIHSISYRYYRDEPGGKIKNL